MFAGDVTPNFIALLTSLTLNVAGRRLTRRYQEPSTTYPIRMVSERRSSVSTAVAIWATFSLEKALLQLTVVIV